MSKTILKNTLQLIFFIFCVFKLSAQKNTIAAKVEYTIHNGFNVSRATKMVYDNDGWLWISGFSHKTNDFKFNDNKFIVQRYDGLSFHTLELPLEESFSEGYIDLHKRADGHFYLLIYNNKKTDLFFINQHSLKIKKIESFIPISKGATSVQFFNYKDEFYVFLSKKNKTDIYTIDSENKLSFLNEIDNKDEFNLFFRGFIPFKNHFIISNDRKGIEAYDYNGNFIKNIGIPKNDANLITVDRDLQMKSQYRYKGNFYITLNDSPYTYRYNETLMRLEKVDVPSNMPSLEIILHDKKDNLLERTFTNDMYHLNRRLISLNKSISLNDNIKVPRVNNVASKNLKKELVVVYNGTLIHYFFTNQQIQTYLNNFSIRSIHQEKDNEFIVATENNGWYKINTTDNTSTQIEFKVNNTPINLEENRNIFSDTTGYWSNYRNGMVRINKKTNQVKTYIYHPIEAMVTDSNNIYYTTIKHNLMQFNKKTHTHTKLANTDTIAALDIIKYKNTLYCASNKGLLIYKSNTAKLINNFPDNDLLSIDYYPEYGIVLGSRSGELYIYNDKTNKHRTVYQDDKKSSIASTLLDNNNQLWINTFAGIVNYNPKTKELTRFTEEDGLSFYEANRHSALKAKDGTLLVGTLKGLNIFTPETLTKNKVIGTPCFTAISYFDTKTKKWVTRSDPKTLQNIQNIKLPATHRRLQLQIGVLGQVNAHKIQYKYRLNNDDWNTLTNKNEISFSNLSSGTYNLTVEAFDPIHGNIGKPLKLSIISKTFFYKTWWFVSLLVLSFLALGYYYYRQLKQKQKLQTQVTQNLIIGQENERTRLARELHDSIGQQLVLLKKKTQKQHISGLTELTSSILTEMRSITKALHPIVLEQMGLTSALKQLLLSVDENTDLFITTDIQNIDDLFTKEQALNLYRFVQESINNSIKHANATAIEIELKRNENFIRLMISDNGQGFNFQEKINTSLGLQTLKERIKILNGKLNITSNSSGTQTLAEIPIKN